MGLGCLVNAYSSHFINQKGGDNFNDLFTKPRRYAHKARKGSIIGSHGARGLVPRMQGDGFVIEPGGIMKVAMWLCTLLLLGFDLAWVGLGCLVNAYSSHFINQKGDQGGGGQF